MMKTGLFAGTFDPFTIGHASVVRRALQLFDRVVVAVGVNTDKHYHFTVDERMQRIKHACQGLENVEVVQYCTLTTDLCRKYGANYIVRGLRSTLDFAYESEIADINRMLAADIETVFLLAEPEYRAVSSSMVRELISFGKDASEWIC